MNYSIEIEKVRLYTKIQFILENQFHFELVGDCKTKELCVLIKNNQYIIIGHNFNSINVYYQLKMLKFNLFDKEEYIIQEFDKFFKSIQEPTTILITLFGYNILTPEKVELHFQIPKIVDVFSELKKEINNYHLVNKFIDFVELNKLFPAKLNPNYLLLWKVKPFVLGDNKGDYLFDFIEKKFDQLYLN
jgi:hypothetical protein